MSSEVDPPAPQWITSRVTSTGASAFFRRIRAGAISDHPIADLTDRPPQSADLLRNYGGFLRSAGRLDDAEAAYRAAITTDPKNATAYLNLGGVLAERDDLEGAAIAYKNAVAVRPRYFEAWRGLGVVLVRLRQYDEAREAFAAAVVVGPTSADALNDLGKTLMLLGRAFEAEDCFRRAIEIDPSSTEGHGSLGALLMSAGRLVAAESMTRRARAAAPAERRWLVNLAVIARDLCRFDESERLLRRALAADPRDAAAHAELLLCLNHHPDRKPDEIFTEYRRFEARHAPRDSVVRTTGFPNKPAQDRRLRLAVLGPSERSAELQRFAVPLLERLDRTKFELFGYGDTDQPVALDGAPSPFEHWRSTIGLSDDGVSDIIRRDVIDVAIDLAGHESGRLLAFARKPAPIQVALPLATPYTTGLAAIDAFLADDFFVPAGTEGLFTEDVVRLGRTPFCWRPPANLPDVTPPPSLTKGYVTFGYLGPTVHLNGRTVRAWAAILKRMPSSRLLLGAKAFEEHAYRDLVASRFATEGIASDRLDLVGAWPETTRWAAYADIDIALDPFPHNALLPSLEALWMGVPVVNLAERPSVGRAVTSVLAATKLADWVALTPAGYVNLAIASARDVARLSTLRTGLRGHMAASQLSDPEGLARAVEKVIHKLWAGWCRRRSPRGPEGAERPLIDVTETVMPVSRTSQAWPVPASEPDQSMPFSSSGDGRAEHTISLPVHLPASNAVPQTSLFGETRSADRVDVVPPAAAQPPERYAVLPAATQEHAAEEPAKLSGANVRIVL